MLSHDIPRSRSWRRSGSHVGRPAGVAARYDTRLTGRADGTHWLTIGRREHPQGRMTHFLGTHQNRLDAKGRVSVPAPFRAALRALANGRAGGNGEDTAALVLRPSHKHPCIEGWPAASFHALAEPLERLDMFGEDHDDLAAAIYADAHPLEADREGRIVLPDALVAHANLSDTVVFMGLGRLFQIWEPQAAERRRLEARERARNARLTLPAGGPGSGSGAGA